MNLTQRLFVVVGSPGSGKDILIRAVKDLGRQHARIVPKHTTRERRADDGDELIFPGDALYDRDGCDIEYENYGDWYGINTSTIWTGLKEGAFLIVVVSDVDAINQLHNIFGELMLLVYVHSEIEPEDYLQTEAKHGKDIEYLQRRVDEYQLAFSTYLKNFLAFSHVLIHSGEPEDLFDQIFRLFRAYERGDLHYTAFRAHIPERIWTEIVAWEKRIIIGDKQHKHERDTCEPTTIPERGQTMRKD